MGAVQHSREDRPTKQEHNKTQYGILGIPDKEKEATHVQNEPTLVEVNPNEENISDMKVQFK